MVVKNRSDIFYFICVAVVFIVAIALRTTSFLTNVYTIHGDECHSLYGSIIPLKDVFSYYVSGANFLPVYKLLMKFIHHFFGYNWFLIKLPSYIFSVISVPLFYIAISKIFKSRLVILSSFFLFSVNYTLLHFTMFAKPYTMDVCFVLVLFIMFLNLENKIETQNIKNNFITFFPFFIFSLLCIFSSVPLFVITVFYWGFLFLQILFTKSKNALLSVVLFFILLLISFLFLYFQLLSKIKADTVLNGLWFCPDYFAIPNSMEAINSLIHFIFFEFKYFDSEITNVLHPVFIILLVLSFFIGCFLLVLNKKIVGFAIVVPFYFFITLSFLYIFPFNNRCITFLIPFFIIVFFYVLDCLIQKYRLLGCVLLGVVFSLFAYQISHNYEKFVELFTFYDSKYNHQIINTAKNSNTKDTAFIAFETVCSFCLNNNKMLYIDQGWHTNEVVANYFYIKTNSFPSKIDKKYIHNKSSVYVLIPMPVTDMQEYCYRDFIVLQKMLSEEGFVEVTRAENHLFVNYILYEKT